MPDAPSSPGSSLPPASRWLAGALGVGLASLFNLLVPGVAQVVPYMSFHLVLPVVAWFSRSLRVSWLAVLVSAALGNLLSVAPFGRITLSAGAVGAALAFILIQATFTLSVVLLRRVLSRSFTNPGIVLERVGMGSGCDAFDEEPGEAQHLLGGRSESRLLEQTLQRLRKSCVVTHHGGDVIAELEALLSVLCRQTPRLGERLRSRRIRMSERVGEPAQIGEQSVFQLVAREGRAGACPPQGGHPPLDELRLLLPKKSDECSGHVALLSLRKEAVFRCSR
jgi:hypothetical protein